jgi:hypothetical protein
VKPARQHASPTTVQPLAPLRHEPVLVADRILMVNLASTQAPTKEVAPPINGKGR